MKRKPPSEAGNILLYILIAIVLIGITTSLLRSSTNMEESVDRESVTLQATSIQKYAAEIARGVQNLVENGVSETDIRFAAEGAPTDYGAITINPSNQVFSSQGGNAPYRLPSPSSLINTTKKWEFWGNTAAPQVGSDKADLLAVLVNINEPVCKAINLSIGYTISTQPLDDSVCVYATSNDRFGKANTVGFDDATTNTMVTTSFSSLPALQACVKCDSGTYNYYYVLLAR